MGKQFKQWQTLFSWAPKSLQMVTAAMKLKRLLLGRKAMTNLDRILKSRDIALPINTCIVKSIPVNWSNQDQSNQDWSNQSILKEISLDYSLEGLMMKLKLQYFGLLIRTDSLENPWYWERLKAGGEEDNRGWDGWMASRTRWTWVWANSGSWWRTGKSGMLQSMGLQRANTTEQLNWIVR